MKLCNTQILNLNTNYNERCVCIHIRLSYLDQRSDASLVKNCFIGFHAAIGANIKF